MKVVITFTFVAITYGKVKLGIFSSYFRHPVNAPGKLSCLHPPNRLGRRHYVFRLSVRLCVRAFILRARAEAFSDGLAVDFF